MTVSELLERMSSKELTEWMAFERLEPFGYRIDFMGHAQTAQVMANSSRDPKKTNAYSLEDFMPSLGTKKEQSTEDQISIAKRLTLALGGSVKEKE